MRRPSSRFRNVLAAIAVLAAWGTPSRARAQACCAGGSAVTPGRLQLHEDALVGLQVKAATVFGSYEQGGGSPSVFHTAPASAPPATPAVDTSRPPQATQRGTSRRTS